jgi:tRNA A-37 threonylcarbamoyl transferase component Bud32
MNSDVSLKIHPEAARILQSREEDVREFAVACLQEHDRTLIAKTGPILKNSPETAVTLVELPGAPKVCVKEFRWRGYRHAAKGLFRLTQGARTFRNGWRLIEHGISCPAPLVLATEKRSGLVRSEWVIMEAPVAALEMDRYLLKRMASSWTPEEKRDLTRMFGRFMGAVHAKGIFHSDLKTCNILVSEERRELKDNRNPEGTPSATVVPVVRFSLLDYDDMGFLWEVSRKKRRKNLSQLFLSVPVAVGAAQRLRFLSEYALHVGMNIRERRATAVEVVRACRGKEILYVGFSGDVREKWE